MKKKFPFLCILGLILTFSATGAGAAMLCRQTHSSVLSSEQISSRIDALITQQIRVQQYDFSEPSLFNQNRAYIENEKKLLAQTIPDFEQTYRDRYLILRNELRQKNKAQKQKTESEEQKRKDLIRTMRVANPKEAFRISHGGIPSNPRFTSDGRSILTGYTDLFSKKYFVQVTDAVSGHDLGRIEQVVSLKYAKFSADGQIFASRTSNKQGIIIGHTFLGQIAHTPPQLQVGYLSYDVSPDGRFVVTSNALKQILIYDVSSGGIVHQLENMDWFPEAGFDANGNFLALEDGVIKWFNPASGKAQHSTSLTLSDAKSTLMSPDRKLRARVTADRTVKIADAASGEVLRETTHESELYDPVFSPDGKFLLTLTDRDTVVSIYDIASGIIIHRIPLKGVVGFIKFNSASTSLIISTKMGHDAIVTSLYQDLGD